MPRLLRDDQLARRRGIERHGRQLPSRAMKSTRLPDSEKTQHGSTGVAFAASPWKYLPRGSTIRSVATALRDLRATTCEEGRLRAGPLGRGLPGDLRRLLGRLASHCVHSRTAATADGWLSRRIGA